MRSLSFVIAAAVVALAQPAAAEVFVDVYAGGAFTETQNATSNVFLFRGRGDFKVSDSAALGLRVGVWGEEGLSFLGAALDVSGFRADARGSSRTEIGVLPISALFLARAPLWRSDAFPAGRIQPFVGVGPALVVSRWEFDFFFPGLPPFFPGIDFRFRDTQTDLGIDVRGGAQFAFNEHVGLFAEYRYLHFAPDYADTEQGARLRFSPSLSTHFAQGGLRFQF